MTTKRIICSVLSMIMVFSLSLSSIAAGYASSDTGENFVTDEMISESSERVKEMIAEGEMIRRTRAQQKKLSVPLLYQDDSRWANVTIPGCGNTYGKVGCAITCYAMMSRYFGNSSETPVTFGQKYYNKYGNPCNQNASKAAAIMGKSATSAPSMSTSSLENFIISSIDKGKPVIIYTNKFGSHYITAYGYYITSEGNATIYIRDPESYDSGTTLSDYKNYTKKSAVSIG